MAENIKNGGGYGMTDEQHRIELRLILQMLKDGKASEVIEIIEQTLEK